MLKWERINRQYINGMNGRLGKYKVFMLEWGMSTPAEDQKCGRNYVLRCYLPGLKSNLGYWDEISGKDYAEQVLGIWLKNTGLRT